MNRIKNEKHNSNSFDNWHHAQIARDASQLHPTAQALEQLSSGDSALIDDDWQSAKSSYLAAIALLEKNTISDRSNLKNGLKRLAYVHLRLFEFNKALACFLKASNGLSKASSARVNEVESIMAKIRAARKGSVNSPDDYTPGFFTGHL